MLRIKNVFQLDAGKFFLCLIVIIFAPCIFTASMTEDEITQLITRTDHNNAPHQYESYMVMKNYKPGRNEVQNRTHCYRKDDKMVVIFVSPPSQKGQAFIRNGNDMWMYLPKSEKTFRIGAKENTMGGEASNTDLLRGDLAKDYVGAYLGEETIDGVLCHKLELKAKQRTVAYDKVIYWISQKKELPVKREYYVISGKMLKTMYFQEIKILGGVERPSVVLIVNEDNKSYKTEMITEEITPTENLEDNIFNPSYIKRLH